MDCVCTGRGAGNPGDVPTGRFADFIGTPGTEEAEHKVSCPLMSTSLVGQMPQAATEAGCTTMWQMIEHACNTHKERNAAGSRELFSRDMVASEADPNKKFEKLTLAPTYTWLTYEQLGKRIANFASGLRTSDAGLKKGDHVLIFAETQRDWAVAEFACFRHAAVVVTAYATLGVEGVSTALNQTKASICVCDGKLFKVLKEAAPQCPSLKYVVPILDPKPDLDATGMAEQLGGKIVVESFESVVERGGAADATTEPSPPEPEDTAIIMYTSGTTGASKGVILQHKSIVSQCRGGELVLKEVCSDTVMLGYLPLAHIFELFVESYVYYKGGSVGYGSPHTLIDSSVKVAKGCQGDAPVLQPTMMIFAPAVLDKVYSGVKRKIADRGYIASTLFDWGIARGYSNYDNGDKGCGWLYDSLVMQKVQANLGGRVNMMFSGSAPLSAEIQKFVQSVFNCPVRQGYGLSETCGASSLTLQTDNTLGTVGPPTPATFIRLRDWEEGGYKNSDVDDPQIGVRRGEVLIGGDTVAKGYLVDEANPDPEIVKKNQEDFVTIGGVRYFCSGDIGQVDNKGRIKIIDRKKDLFKGENGEYVSLSKVESILKLCSYVEMPMVYGRTGAKNVIALIAPQAGAIVKLGREKGLGEDVVALCKHPDVVAEVTKACLKTCKEGKLVGFEIPAAISLCVASDGGPAWTPENDLLTSTMKLKRPPIAKAFVAEVDDAYARAAN